MTRGNQRNINRERALKKQKETEGNSANRKEGDPALRMEDQANIMREKQRLADQRKNGQ